MDNKKLVREVVEKHNLMHIATIGADGIPSVRGVDYAMGDNENELYFITNKMTSKIAEIERNPNVSVVIDHDCNSMEELASLRYIKGTGKAEILRNPADVQKVFGLILKKFPYLSNLPGEPSDFVGIKVELDKVYLTDNTQGFGKTFEIKY